MPGALENYAPFHVARVDMLRRLDRLDEARDAFERALPFADNKQVRRFIESRLRSHTRAGRS
jgi:RNA polymerase sigma-70 factor (ECF subfamily)